METTLSVIKADTGGFVGHTEVHPEMVRVAKERVCEAVDAGLVIDGQVNRVGDDLALILTHQHGANSERVHGFAWEVFKATTEVATRLGMYGAGQDLLADAFSGNLRGMGPGYAEMPSSNGRANRSSCFWPTRPSPAPSTFPCRGCSPIPSPPSVS